MTFVNVERHALPALASPRQFDVYRILLLRKEGSELLVSGDRPPFALPQVEIRAWQRVAEQLTAALRTRYGINSICLFAPDADLSNLEHRLYQVMEAKAGDCIARADMRWLSTEACSNQLFTEQQDFVAISGALRQINEFREHRVGGPFCKPGWLEELISWVQLELDACGLHLTGEFRQVNASPTFALLRFETDGPAVWFKAVGEPNLRELPISLTLSSLFPGCVPTVIAPRWDLNGWLSLELARSTLDEARDDLAWEHAAQTLAQLQIASLGKTDQLLAMGCRDLRVSSLLALVDPFMQVMSQLMERQPKIPPQVLGRAELQMLGRQINEILTEWQQLSIPDTLGHLDLNPGNIICSSDQCAFLDWAEAYVGPPFLTFEYLRAHLMRLRQDVSVEAHVVRSYHTKWHTMLSAETVAAGNDLAPVLAVFGLAVGTGAWQNPSVLRERKIDAYLRSLTRRTHVELHRLNERRQLCCK